MRFSAGQIKQRQLYDKSYGLVVKRLRRRPLTAQSRVRFPARSPKKRAKNLFFCPFFFNFAGFFASCPQPAPKKGNTLDGRLFPSSRSPILSGRRLQGNDTIPGRSHDLSACAGLPAPGCKSKPPADQVSPQDAASAWTRPAGGFLFPRPSGALRRTRSVRAFLFRYIFL